MRVLGFTKNGFDVYIPVDIIKGIYQDESVYRYTEISFRVFGIMFVNGEVIPVLDVSRLFEKETVIESVSGYDFRCSVILVESNNGLMAFIYDDLKDIYDRDNVKDIPCLSIELISSGFKTGSFFVENIKIIEDIVLGIEPNISRLKEILLCPKKY